MISKKTKEDGIMKRFLLFALCAVVALASCQKANETGIAPEQSSLKVTAVIADNATKVDYDVIDNIVTPKWVEGDEIFGYDGTGTFTFTVTAVDDSGVATFKAGDYTPTDGTTLHAVYYPGKDADDFTSGELAVDLTSQNGVLDGTAPAIMCATATVQGGEVSFKFLNQTAIIGVKKFQTNPNELINTFKASGLVATGTIKVVGEALALVPDTTPADMTIACNYAADATTGMYENPVYFIAMPTESAAIDIKATSSKGTEGIYSTPTAVNANILAGNYYYMSKKLASEHVARYSNDGGTTWTYTESLADAISGIATKKAKTNGKVELLKDVAQNEKITISLKNFSFDGNGHTITAASLTGAQTFAVDSSDISFENVKISGPGFNVKVNNKAINISKHSTLTLGKGCCITGFNSTNNGGAIHCTASTVNMTDDAKIENCQSVLAASSYTKLGGGAVFCESASGNASTLNMSGNASISNCKADQGGGAICLYGKNTLSISGNALIEKCEAGTSGGAITATTNANTINISGSAHITDCSAKNGSGGAICDNQTGSALTITDNVVIDNCSATNMGGAFYDAGTVNVKGSAKIENCSAKFGGGFALYRKATIDENALIKSCTAERGGAVYDTTATANYGVLEMKGNSCIDGCEAQRGGGIYTCQTNATSCTVTGNASIINCVVKHTAKTVYAGTAIFANSVLNVSGDVLFSGNTAQTTAASPSIYGNIILSASSKGNVTISGGTFLSNAKWNCMATADAGSKMTISGGCFANAGSGSIFSYAFTDSNKVVVSGGYFNKSITDSSRATLKSGYKLVTNPNTSEADQAASALGCTYKVVAQ